MRRKLCIIAALLVVATLGIVAQVNKPALIVRANVEGADIALNGIPLGKTSPNFAILLDPGSYGLKVSKSGYSEFSTLITLPPESLVVNVTLVPIFTPPPTTPTTLPSPPPVTPPSSAKGAFDAKTVRQGGGDVLRSMAPGFTRLVAVGNSMFTIYSNEGQRWLNAPKFPTSGNFIAVRWVKDRFLAAGDYGVLYSSTDGIVWSKQNSGTTKNLGPMVWAGGRFLMVGQSGTILASQDGAKWTALPVTVTNNLFNIIFDGSMVVVTGATGLITYSSDAGVSWNKVSTGLTDHIYGLAAGKPGFVAGGSGQNAPILFSPDGKKWSVVYKSKSAQTFGAVFWDGEKFIVGGSYGALLVSENGQDWREVPALENAKHAVAFAEISGALVLAQHDGTILNLSWNPGAGGGSGGSGGAVGSGGSGSAGPAVTLIDEDFENKAPPGILPPGWLSRDNKNPTYPYAWDCAIDNRNAHSGVQFVMAQGFDKGLITPAIAIPSGGSATVSFWLRNRQVDYGGKLDVLLSYGGSDQRDFTDTLGKIARAPDSYQKYSFDIGGLYAGRTVRIMFYASGNESGQILQIDDVQVTAKGGAGGSSGSGGSGGSGGPVQFVDVVALDQDFEGLKVPDGIPSGWIARNNKDFNDRGAWEIYPEAGKSHSGSLYARTVFAADKVLITPPITIPQGGSGTVSFWARSEDGNALENLSVLLSASGTDQKDFSTLLGLAQKIPTRYQNYSFDIGSQFGGKTVRLQFRVSDPGNHYILDLDDVTVTLKVPSR